MFWIEFCTGFLDKLIQSLAGSDPAPLTLFLSEEYNYHLVVNVNVIFINFNSTSGLGKEYRSLLCLF